jgi:UDP-2-acetamido-3-amino-2,3-dideoxy-glucuronate N-acetyltransferase
MSVHGTSSSGQAREPAVFVHPDARVEPGVFLGEGCRVWSGAHLRTGARLGGACVIGSGAFIDADVPVGARCKIQNNALVYKGSILEDEVFIGPGACLTNDRRPRATNVDGTLKSEADWTLDGVTVQRSASVGAHSVVVAGVRIGHHAMVGAGSVVVHDVPAHALVVGNPARLLDWVCACGERLHGGLQCQVCGRRYLKNPDGLEML